MKYFSYKTKKIFALNTVLCTNNEKIELNKIYTIFFDYILSIFVLLMIKKITFKIRIKFGIISIKKN